MVLLNEMMNQMSLSKDQLSLRQQEFVYRAEKLVQLAAAADSTITAPLTESGPTSSVMEKLKAKMFSSQESSALNSRCREYIQGLQEATATKGSIKIVDGEIRMDPETQDVESMCQWMSDHMQAQDQLRLKMRGSPWKPPRPFWAMRSLPNSPVRVANYLYNFIIHRGAGMIIYRLAYNIPDKKWEEFVRRLEKDIYSYFDELGIKDSDQKFLSLHWFDGRNFGIRAGDVQTAARLVHPINPPIQTRN